MNAMLLSRTPRLVLGFVALSLGGCAAYGGPHYPAGPAGVPPGHMPPPGDCRIWFPNRPPGHQPPPGPCHALQYQVPPSAYLVRG